MGYFLKGYVPGGHCLHGERLAVKNSLLPSLTKTPVGIGERLMLLCIPLTNNNFATLFSAYVPTIASENAVKGCFYLSLEMKLSGKSQGWKHCLVVQLQYSSWPEKQDMEWSAWWSWHWSGQCKWHETSQSLCWAWYYHRKYTVPAEEQIQNILDASRFKHWHLIDYIIMRCSNISNNLITRVKKGAKFWTDHHIIIDKLHISIKWFANKVSLSYTYCPSSQPVTNGWY